MLKPFNGDIAREIHALLTVENDTGAGSGRTGGINPDAMREVETQVSMNIEFNKPVYLRDILNHFARRPYGWPEEEVKLQVCSPWHAKGKFSFSQQNNNIDVSRSSSITAVATANCVCTKFVVTTNYKSQAAQTMAKIASSHLANVKSRTGLNISAAVFDYWKQEPECLQSEKRKGKQSGQK